MRTWNVHLTGKAYKQLKKLAILIQDLVDECIQDLQREGPSLHYWNVKKFGTNSYRVRLNYRYRMRYTVIEDKLLIEIFYIGHRKDAYKLK